MKYYSTIYVPSLSNLVIHGVSEHTNWGAEWELKITGTCINHDEDIPETAGDLDITWDVRWPVADVVDYERFRARCHKELDLVFFPLVDELRVSDKDHTCCNSHQFWIGEIFDLMKDAKRLVPVAE